jgi:hypothetical protein
MANCGRSVVVEKHDFSPSRGNQTVSPESRPVISYGELSPERVRIVYEVEGLPY